jgi:hypothetical protein
MKGIDRNDVRSIQSKLFSRHAHSWRVQIGLSSLAPKFDRTDQVTIWPIKRCAWGFAPPLSAARCTQLRGRVSRMMNIPNLGRRLAQSLGIAAAAVLMMSATQRAEALSPVNPAASPIAKYASDALITEVRGGHGGGHGGGGHHGGGGGHFGGGGFRGGGAAVHGGGFRGGGAVFHGGGVRAFHGGGGFYRGGGARFAAPMIARHHYYAPRRAYFAHRHHFRPRYYGYAPTYYYGPRRFCRTVWTYYGPRRICRYRPWHHHWRHHRRHHHWRVYW